MKILTIVGARPQFVKAAVVSRVINKRVGIEEKIIHTGQHFDDNMSKVFFEEMEIPKPHYNLNVNGGNHGKMTGNMMEHLEEVMINEKPDIVNLYGDTNSTLAGALVASKLRIPISHIEAGLRSFNMDMPEEINRILTDRVSNWLFCPTQTAVNNLENEGYNNIKSHISLSGDVMYDAALYYSEKIDEIPAKINLPNKDFILVTVHRQENTHDIKRLKQIISILNDLSATKEIMFPLHPGTKKRITDSGLKLNFTPIDPVGYFDMIRLLKSCEFVVTDSGGLQKEAFFFDKYCFTLRDETEWVELVDNGVNFICGADQSVFEKHLSNLTVNFPNHLSLYGKGNAGEVIVDELLKYS